MQLSKSQAALLSVGSNTLLTLLKLAVGIISHSLAMLSEAAHSAVDLVASIVTYFSVSYAEKPADREHPYGHGKMENISGVIEGLLIVLIAIWIIWEGVERLIYGVKLTRIGWGLLIMCVSFLANVFVSRILYRVAKRTNSIALLADWAHLASDVYTSAGVIVALFIIYVVREWADKELYFLDPVLAMAIAVYIVYLGIKITRKAFPALLDGRASFGEEQEIINLISSFREKNVFYHKLRTRRSGSKILIDFHLLFSNDTHIDEAHKISHELKNKIENSIPNSEVLIHLEPEEDEHLKT